MTLRHEIAELRHQIEQTNARLDDTLNTIRDVINAVDQLMENEAIMQDNLNHNFSSLHDSLTVAHARIAAMSSFYKSDDTPAN